MKTLFPAALAERLWLGRNTALRAAAVVCIALLCADLALYLIVLRPLNAGLEARRAHIAGLRARHADAVLYQSQKKTLGGIAAAVPTQKDMPLLVKELQQTARRLGLRVGDVNYDIPKPGAEGAALLSFSFPVAGSYPELKRFVFEVETSPRLLGIETLEFRAERGTVGLDLKLMTYVRSAERR